jgi:7-cyano-7-deazaguanine synthase
MSITPPTIGLLISGGLDSAILAGHLLDRGQRVQPFYIQSNLHWQAAERAVLDTLLARLACPRLAPLVELALPLGDLYGNHWSVSGRAIPDLHSADKAVFLPGRNTLLIVKAAIWCQLHGIDRLALATLVTNPFGDAGDEFFQALEAALNIRGTAPIRLERPFGQLTKREVMELGREMPLELTFCCLDPVASQERSSGPRWLHCGRCNKCAERRAAFALIEMSDTTRYGYSNNESRMSND